MLVAGVGAVASVASAVADTDAGAVAAVLVFVAVAGCSTVAGVVLLLPPHKQVRVCWCW